MPAIERLPVKLTGLSSPYQECPKCHRVGGIMIDIEPFEGSYWWCNHCRAVVKEIKVKW